MTAKLTSGRIHDVRLDISITEDLWLGRYTHIEVWRSKLGEAGPYEEITAQTWATALVPNDAGAPSSSPGPLANISGKVLSVEVSGGGQFQFTFVGSDPFTFATAATQVTNTARPYFKAYVDVTGKFVLETLNGGGSTFLKVLGGDAAALLGLPLTPPESIAVGHDPRLPLAQGKTLYSFRDFYGSDAYFYKIRFIDEGLGVVGAFSDPINATPNAGVSSASLIAGFVQLTQLDGRPHVKQEVSVYSLLESGFQVEGFIVSSGQVKKLTDGDGYAEFLLIRGMPVDVSIAGMNLMRRITVPTDPTIDRFNLLDPTIGTDDTFVVQRPNIPYAEKTNI